MALALYGGGITDQRGSVGGNTFSRSRYGATIRAKTSPLNPKTTFQGEVRVRLQSISNMWSQVLSDSDRAQWNAFALTQPTTNRFGQISYLSGQQMFNSLSNNLVLVGGTISNTPPVTSSYPGVTSFVINAGSSPGEFVEAVVTGTPATGTPWFLFYYTQCLTAGTSYVSSKLKLIANTAGADATFTVTSNWKSRFGNYAPVAGQKIFGMIRVIDQTTGASSAMINAVTIVT